MPEDRKEFKGRRREDTEAGELPDNLQSGDYWKLLIDGRPMSVAEPNKLTTTCWGIYLHGFGVASLTKHTVRELPDGTINVLPNDGSSNSIKVTKPSGAEWHGYIYAGTWRSV